VLKELARIYLKSAAFISLEGIFASLMVLELRSWND
jgi:hypothetical protein